MKSSAVALFAILQCISTYGRILNISFENAYIKDTHAKILLKVIDEVVANGDDSVDELLSRKFAWYNQEMQKGGYLVDLVPEAGWAFGANYMVEESTGWWPDGQMHSYTRHYNAVEAAGIDPEDLKTRPLFSDFLRRQVYGAGGHDFLSSTNEVSRMARWRMLSHGIPSESFAVGANPVPKWRDIDDESKRDKRNIDMALQCCREDAGKKGAEWIHSYFIQRPLYHTSGLYEKMAELIGKTKKEKLQ